MIRDYRSLYLAFAIPLILIILFGYALSLDVDNRSGVLKAVHHVAQFGTERVLGGDGAIDRDDGGSSIGSDVQAGASADNGI